jgi:hypothetical protein
VESLESAYPGAKFLTGRGTGRTREEANNAAIRQISQTFGVSVSIKDEDRASLSTRNGRTDMRRDLTQESVVSVYTELFNLKYAEQWWNPQARQWETLVYIDREEAWRIYEPRLRSAAAAFLEAFGAADTAGPLSQYRNYRAAARLGGEAGGVKDALAYAQVLHPGKAGVGDYKKAQDALAALPVRIQAALDGAILTVECEGDFENIVTSAIIEAFRKGGFKAAAGKTRGSNRAVVKIAENSEKLEAGTFYAPRLTLTVYGSDKALFSWSANAARKGAWDANAAKRGRWNALAEEINQTMLRDFNAALDGGNK